MTRNLQQVCGVNVNQGHPLDRLPMLYEAGFRKFAVTAQMYQVMTRPDAYDSTFLSNVIATLPNDAEIMCGLYKTPCWTDPAFEPRHDSEAGCWIPKFGGVKENDEQSLKDIRNWKEFVTRIVGEFRHRISKWHIGCETNLKSNNMNPADKGEGDSALWTRNVVRPAAEIIHDYGGKVIAVCQTLQGEKDQTFMRAVKHFIACRKEGRRPLDKWIDHLDVHIYRDDNPEAVETDWLRLRDEVMKQTGSPLPPQECYMTEWGFNEGSKHVSWVKMLWYKLTGTMPSGEDFQCEKIIPVMEWLKEDKCGILEAYYYRGFDDPAETTIAGTNGLITRTGAAKKSLQLMSDYLLGKK